MVCVDYFTNPNNLGNLSMVGNLVPLKGGIGSIVHPPGSARTISGI